MIIHDRLAAKEAKQEAEEALEVLLSFTEQEEDQKLILDAISNVHELRIHWGLSSV